MPQSEWKLITDLVLEALDLPEGERQQFLDNRCRTDDGSVDESLRKEVDNWIRAADQAESGNAFDSPVSGLAVDAADAENLVEFSIPDAIGPWRPVRRLGAGGMGVVYEAQRIEKSFDQRVALKLVRSGFLVDLGARFLRERSVLAELNHPGIARLLDGGITGDGVPYLATELIEGLPITTYCTSNNLPMRERLKIFAKVCEAVAYAHQNLVVHRDLKPAHIFVVEIDGQPAIKLLDFGIAKLLESRDDGLTQTGTVPYTPAYAAPEQLQSLPITTATDVYALGILLYEVLTGRRPYELDNTTAAETEQIICRRVPPAPSTQVEQSSVRRALKGELDQIIMKAISKEPKRRYGSAQSMGDDVRRYLSGQPVDALPDIASYRFRKFISRNRVAVSAAFLITAITIVLITAFTISINRQKVRAESAARTASAEAERATAIADFLERVLRAPNANWYVQSENKGPETPIIDVLDEAAHRIDIDFQEQPEIRADLHHIIGDTYMSLNDEERTTYHHQRSLAIRESLYVAPHPKIAEALYYISLVEGGFGRTVERAVRLREALDMLRLRNEGNNYPFILEELATIAASIDAFDEAIILLTEAEEFVAANFVQGTDGYRYRQRLLGSIQWSLGRTYVLAGDITAAGHHFQKSHDLWGESGVENGLYHWLENNCYEGLRLSLIDDFTGSEKHLITCFDHLHPKAYAYDQELTRTEAGVEAAMNRPAGLRGWAANHLERLYTRMGQEAIPTNVSRRAEGYRSEVDSLRILIGERHVLEGLVN